MKRVKAKGTQGLVEKGDGHATSSSSVELPTLGLERRKENKIK
jgi:hypothetical protein